MKVMDSSNYKTPSEVLTALLELQRCSAFQLLYLPTLIRRIKELEGNILTRDISEHYSVDQLLTDRQLLKELKKQAEWLDEERKYQSTQK